MAYFRARNVFPLFGPPSLTYAWQPLDSGLIAAFERELKKMLWGTFLTEPGTYHWWSNGAKDAFTGTTSGASERRIMSKRICDATWEAMAPEAWGSVGAKAFLRTGRGISHNGERGEEIGNQFLPTGYRPPPVGTISTFDLDGLNHGAPPIDDAGDSWADDDADYYVGGGDSDEGDAGSSDEY